MGWVPQVVVVTATDAMARSCVDWVPFTNMV